MSALLIRQNTNVNRREEPQTSRRLCLISIDAASGSARRLVGQRSWLSVMCTNSDANFIGVIMLTVETNSPSLPTMLAPAVEPA